MTSFKIPYGKTMIPFEVPKEFDVTVVKNNSKSQISDIIEATRKALKNPINTKGLSELVKKGNTVCVIVTDITRPCPDRIIIPILLDEIKTKIEPSDLKLLIASGMHREMTYDDKGEIIGFAKGGPLESYKLRPAIKDENYGLYNTVFLEPLSLRMGYYGLGGGSEMRHLFTLQAHAKKFKYLTSFALREVIRKRVESFENAEFVIMFDPERRDYYRIKL